VLKRVSIRVGSDVVLGEDRLQHIDPLGAGVIATVVAVVAVVAGVGVRVIVVLVGMHGSVVVPMKSTHRQYLSRDNLSRDIQRRHQELVAAQHLDVGTLATRAQQ
jgi:hypothetical protein